MNRAQAAPLAAPATPTPAFRIGAVDDAAEREADAAADRVLRRKCDACEGEEKLHRSASGGGVRADAGGAVAAALAEPGAPLRGADAGFFGSGLGADLSGVRVHEGAAAHRAAESVGARAFALGGDIVFARGEYRPETRGGRRLLAHELAHVAQEDGALRRSLAYASSGEPASAGGELPIQPPPRPPPRRPAPPPRPEVCPPPNDMPCPAAMDSPAAVMNTIRFPVGSYALTTLQLAEIDATAAAWHAAGGGVTVRVDGYASAEGECGMNWRLSCMRAEAVMRELASPTDGSPGVPSGSLEQFAHGEDDQAGRGLAPNRRATIAVPDAPLPPPPPPPPSPPCGLPVRIGHARGCGGGTDFTHFDFPAISLGSEVKLAAWAAARVPSRPHRSLVTDVEAMFEMDRELVALGGTAGHDAFSHFVSGGGAKVTHGTSSTLGAMALASGSLASTVSAVQLMIESELAAQAASGSLDACAISVTPPATHFAFSDGWALKAVIGGTQGEELFIDSFTADPTLRSYDITLRFVICDDFGVDEADLYSPGLMGFWVLQHERSASSYMPYINELELPVTISGSF